MSRRKAPSKGDRHGSRGGKPVAVGGRAAVAPPALKDGFVRCPVCRNAARITQSQRLRKHYDLFGDLCYNKAPEVVRPRLIRDEGPVVVESWTRTPDVEPVVTEAVAPPEREPGEPSRLDVGSHCQDCGKWLPGERKLCGQCLIKRGNV